MARESYAVLRDATHPDDINAIQASNQNRDGTPFVMGVGDMLGTPMGFQQVTGLTASTLLTVPAGANMAIIQAQAQAVRWRDDGVAPTATVGVRIAVNETLRYFGGSLTALRFIQEAATAVLNVSYYRQ